MPSLRGIIRHLETTYFTTAAISEDELAACLPFPRYLLFFSQDVALGERRDLQQPGVCRLASSAVQQLQPCCHTAKSGGTVVFCLLHSPCAVRPTPSGSISFTMEVLCSCVRVVAQHLLSVVDLLSLYKPSPQESHKGTSPSAHTGQQQLCSPTAKDSSCVKVGSERGRTFPKGHHGSSVTGLFVPLEQEQELHSTIRLTLLWYFPWESQNLHPSPQQGLQLAVQNSPEVWGRAEKAEHHSQYSNGGKLWQSRIGSPKLEFVQDTRTCFLQTT